MGMIKATKPDGTLVWVEPATAEAIPTGGTLVETRAGTRIEVREAPEHFFPSVQTVADRVREVLQRSAGPVSMSALLRSSRGASTAAVAAALESLGAQSGQIRGAGRPATVWWLP
jgi:hypothetical protein